MGEYNSNFIVKNGLVVCPFFAIIIALAPN